MCETSNLSLFPNCKEDPHAVSFTSHPIPLTGSTLPSYTSVLTMEWMSSSLRSTWEKGLGCRVRKPSEVSKLS